MLADDRKMRMCVMAACGGKKRSLVHKFPADPKRAEEWRQIINQPVMDGLSLDAIRKRMFVCTKHFRPQDYKHAESRSLNMTAVPSLLLDPPPKPQPASDDSGGHPQVSTSGRNNEEETRQVGAPDPEMLRFEIKFDTVELLHPSDISDIDVASIEQHLNDEDGDLDDDTRSILEPNPLRANTYTLLNTSTSSSSRKRRYSDRETRFNSTDEHDEDRPDEEEVVVMSLSSDIFQELQNQLMQQQQLQTSTSQIIVRNSNNNGRKGVEKIERACSVPRNNEDLELEELQEVLLADTPLVLDVSIVSDELATICDNPSRTMATEKGNQDEFTIVKLLGESQPLEISNFWLRDHCRCSECYDTETWQRKQSIVDIPIDIRPLSVQLSDNSLLVTWIDGHSSIYDLSNLKCLLRGGPASTVSPTFWSKAQIEQSPYARVTLNDYLCDDNVAKSIVASLVRFGMAFIEKVPANLQSTEMAVKRLFPIHKTFFGEMWSFSDNKDHADSAYSKAYLGAHTDNTYFNDAAGLQVLHCIQHTGTGGESLLLDGFKVLEALSISHPDAYERLCEVNVPAEYIEDKQHHKYCAPIIRLDPQTGQPEQIRFNLYDRSPMNTLSQRQMLQFYTDLRCLTSEIQSPENEWWFKLNPGTVVIFDNWRLLHGRAAYTGRRQIAGCYVSRTEFRSVARTMGIVS